MSSTSTSPFFGAHSLSNDIEKIPSSVAVKAEQGIDPKDSLKDSLSDQSQAPSAKKRKKDNPKSDVIQRSFAPIIGSSPHTLVLGSFPSEKSQETHDSHLASLRLSASARLGLPNSSPLPPWEDDKARFEAARYAFLRGGSGPMNYGNWKNPFWNIAGVALGFVRELTTYEEKKEAFVGNGYALWDVCGVVEKKEGSR